MKAQLQQKLFDEFRREAGDHAEMFLGKIEQGYPPSGARVEGLKSLMIKLSPSKPLRDRIQAVTVVPMLEPMMTPTACLRVMMPELTKPTTMTVVAEEDWMTAVTAAPSRKPLSTVELIFARMVCSLPPAWRSRALPMVSMPNRNSARPPSREMMLKR